MDFQLQTFSDGWEAKIKAINYAHRAASWETILAMGKKLRALTNEEISAAPINNSKYWHSKGVKLVETSYGNEVMVHIMGYPTLRLFENGTQNREYTLRRDATIVYDTAEGQKFYKFKRGDTIRTGKVKPLKFFAKARARGSEIVAAGQAEWKKQMDKLSNSIQ